MLAAPVVAGLSACSPSQAPTDKLIVGEPFPNIPLITLDGEESSLLNYRGRLVVLNLWATWCEPCRLEMPNLQQLSDTLDAQRFAVLGVSIDDDAPAVREYLHDKAVRFARYIDVDGEVAAEQLGVRLYPYTFLIAPDGTFIQRIPGPREWHRPEVVVLLEAAYGGDYSGLQATQ